MTKKLLKSPKYPRLPRLLRQKMCGHPVSPFIHFIKQERHVVKLTIKNVKITLLLK